MKREHYYQEFVRDRSWKYKTPEELDTAFDRFLKSKKGLMLTEDEFLMEAEAKDIISAKEIYKRLADLVQNEILHASKVYQYARYQWCLNDAAAIVAYEVRDGRCMAAKST